LKRFIKKSTFIVKPNTITVNLNNNHPLKGLKILHISDLHINIKTPYNEIIYLINTINSIHCHFVVLSGDLIDTKVSQIKNKLLLLKNIKKKVYFTSGNHDLVYGYNQLQQILQECNVISLDNRYEILTYENNKFILWGLSDRFSKFFKIDRDEKRLVETIKTFNIPKIFIAHQPKDYTYGLKTKSILFLTGHTHGGQIFPFHLIVRLFQPFLKGLHYKNDMAIYVNSGIGAWGVKYRFLSNAEIAYLQLK